jgi:hypothetical protein
VSEKHVLSQVPLEIQTQPSLGNDLLDYLIAFDVCDCNQLFIASDCCYVKLKVIQYAIPASDDTKL